MLNDNFHILQTRRQDVQSQPLEGRNGITEELTREPGGDSKQQPARFCAAMPCRCGGKVGLKT